MVSSGTDDNKNVIPILVDSDGRPYILLSDGSQTLSIDASNRAEVSVLNVKPDGVNTLKSFNSTARAGYVKLTDGADIAGIDTDDDNIAGQDTLIVINLNYVYDGAKWVRMTQP